MKRHIITLLIGILSYSLCWGQMPEISIVCENGDVIIPQKNGNVYSSGNIEVMVKGDFDKGMTFTLHSPETPIKTVKAKWNISAKEGAKYLSDHWERGYGDLQWLPIDGERIMPWYFLTLHGDRCEGLGVMTGCRSFCSWQRDKNSVTLNMDVRNGSHGVELGNRTLDMATVVTCKGKTGEKPFSLLRRFCKVMCPVARLPKEPVYGINDWYFAYGNNSDSLIMQTVEMMQDLIPDNGNRPFCLIDAGWACVAPGKANACCWSDNFYTSGKAFPDMKDLASRIKEKGFRPGLWMRPLCAPYGADEKLLMPQINRSDNPTDRILDPTVQENRDYIRHCFQCYNDWGYEMVKHDFSTVDILGKWGFEMMDERDITRPDWQFSDKSITTAEAILNLYNDIREAAGDIYIIGCNTVSHLSAGIFELQRIGDDTSGKEWARTLKMGVNTLAFRGAQHNIFYAADADCVGLTTQVDWKLNRQWMELLAESGTPFFISAQPEMMGEEQRAAIKKCFLLASQNAEVGEPIDWLETLTPSKWILRGKEVNFQWE